MATKAEKASIENPDIGPSLGTVEGIAAVWSEEVRQPYYRVAQHDVNETCDVNR
ncbi:MAG: hypothetical protein MJE77_25055 [Proteobacteria bacterium]|nr:hypothetical protein [Pseudomonadota bacterium]